VLIGFFEGVEGGGHAQSGFPQPHGFRPPSVAIIGYWVPVFGRTCGHHCA
jgi:hypothetical protein